MNTDILAQNLLLLETIHGISPNQFVLSEDKLDSYEIIECRDHNITLRFHDKFIGRSFLVHSLESVKNEGDAYASSFNDVQQTLVCFGFGLGHHLAKLLELDKKMEILILNDEAFFIAMHFEWIKRFIESPNVKFILVRETPSFDLYLKQIEASKDKTNLILHTPSLQIREMIHDRISARIANIRLYTRTYDWLLPTLLENYEHNITTYKQYFKDIQGVFRGKTVVVTMSGPSLEKDLDSLAPYRDQFYMLSVTSSLKTIQKKGMQPDAVIIQDALPANFKHIEGIEWEIPLLAISTSSPYVLNRWKGPVYLIFQKSLPFGELKIEPLMVISGTVAFAAINCVLLSNAKEVILTGLDLCFSQNTTHSDGAVFKTDIDPEAYPHKVENYHGEKIPTDTLLVTYKMELEILFKAAMTPIYNLTHFGARLPNTQRITASDLKRIFK